MLWPFVLTGVLLAWDRYVRLRRKPGAAPARAGPLLALTALAIISHPTLDWLNNYGMRWLMPFDGRWFYGDALFVIDPWFWLLVGGAAFLTFSKSRLARVRWACLRVGYGADRVELDAGGLERSRGGARARGGRVGRRRGGIGRGSVAATRCTAGQCSNVRRRPVSRLRPFTSSRCWPRARRHATRFAPSPPSKAS